MRRLFTGLPSRPWPSAVSSPRWTGTAGTMPTCCRPRPGAGAAVATHLGQWVRQWGARGDDAQALAVLAQALGGEVRGGAVHLADAGGLTALLSAPAGEAVSAPDCAWLAWLLWTGGTAQVEVAPGGWRVVPAPSPALPRDWLADAMERLGHAA